MHQARREPRLPPRHLGENGALLPGPHATLAGPTFEEWLGPRQGGISLFKRGRN